MAFAFNTLSGATENRELVEGITVLFAVAVLFYVSNWMVGKAEATAWTGYIEGKVQSSVAKGSLFSLAFAAFLAVFREGAELILFYWALLVDTKTYVSMVWAGLGAGCAVLVVIYILIRFMSVRLPLKPFFSGNGNKGTLQKRKTRRNRRNNSNVVRWRVLCGLYTPYYQPFLRR
jgi:high-affinity iron transporter